MLGASRRRLPSSSSTKSSARFTACLPPPLPASSTWLPRPSATPCPHSFRSTLFAASSRSKRARRHGSSSTKCARTLLDAGDHGLFSVGRARCACSKLSWPGYATVPLWRKAARRKGDLAARLPRTARYAKPARKTRRQRAGPWPSSCARIFARTAAALSAPSSRSSTARSRRARARSSEARMLGRRTIRGEVARPSPGSDAHGEWRRQPHLCPPEAKQNEANSAEKSHIRIRTRTEYPSGSFLQYFNDNVELYPSTRVL